MTENNYLCTWHKFKETDLNNEKNFCFVNRSTPCSLTVTRSWVWIHWPLHVLSASPHTAASSTVKDIHVRVTGDSKLVIDVNEYERSSFCDRLATCPACILPIALRKLGWTSDALLQEQTGGWMHFDANYFFFNFWEPWNINYCLLTLLVLTVLPGLKATLSPPLRASANYFCVEK